MSTLKCSTLSALSEWADFQMSVLFQIKNGALTGTHHRDCRRGSSLYSLRLAAIKSYKSYKNYKMTPLMQAMWKMHEMFAQPCAASSST